MNNTDQLLASKTWEAARGFTLDDRVRVVVAAQAALLVLGLSLDHYRGQRHHHSPNDAAHAR